MGGSFHFSMLVTAISDISQYIPINTNISNIYPNIYPTIYPNISMWYIYIYILDIASDISQSLQHRRNRWVAQVVVRQILCCIAAQPSWSQLTAELAEKYRTAGVVGAEAAPRGWKVVGPARGWFDNAKMLQKWHEKDREIMKSPRKTWFLRQNRWIWFHERIWASLMFVHISKHIHTWLVQCDDKSPSYGSALMSDRQFNKPSLLVVYRNLWFLKWCVPNLGWSWVPRVPQTWP